LERMIAVAAEVCMRAILKGFLLALFVCVLPVACGPEEPDSGGEHLCHRGAGDG
jgi:hypothetical protein